MPEYLSHFFIRDTLWHSVIALLNYGYVITILALLIWYASKRKRETVKQLLSVANWLLLIVAIVSLTETIYTLLRLYFDNADGYGYERWSFYKRRFLSYPSITTWLVLKQIAPLLFFIPKFRATLWLPVLIVLLGYPEDYVIMIVNMMDDGPFSEITLSYYKHFLFKFLCGFALYVIVGGVIYFCIQLRHKQATG